MLGIELPPEEPKDFGFHLQTQRKGIWQAAFEQENEIVSWLSRSQGDYNIPEEGFNSWEELRRIGREQDFESVVGVRNRKSFNAALQNIDRERENKRILDAAPWWQSTLAQIAAGTLSPTMLLPGGGAVKSVKGGFSIAKSALLTGSWAGMGVAAQEAALQAIQQNRTIAEGAINVAGGVLLGGLLGAGAAGVLTRAERKILEQKVLPPLYGASGEQIDKAVIRATDLTELKADLNKAKSDWVMSPRAVMDPDGRLELVAAVARLTPDVALDVKAHGTSSVDDLVRILDKGPDPERQFFTGDLGGQGQGVSAKVSNDFLVIMDKETGKTPVAVVRNPKKMMATRTWQQIMQEVLPEDMLAAKHQELLLARRTAIVKKRTYSEDGKVEFEEETVVDLGPDIAAVGKGLELAYRIKGMYNRTPNGEDGGGRPPNSTIYNLFYKPEIKNSVKQLEDALKKQLYGEPLKDDDGSVPENYGGFFGSDNPAGSDEGQSSDVDGGDTGEDGGVERDGGDDGADTGR